MFLEIRSSLILCSHDFSFHTLAVAFASSHKIISQSHWGVVLFDIACITDRDVALFGITDRSTKASSVASISRTSDISHASAVSDVSGAAKWSGAFGNSDKGAISAKLESRNRKLLWKIHCPK